MNNFETRNILDRDPYSEEVLEKLYQKAQKKIEPYRPQPDDFRDVFGDEVDADMAIVKQYEEKWKKDAEKLSDYDREKKEKKDKIAYTAEFIIADQLSGEWLLNKGECTPTSKYDDYKHGVDMVIEFDEGDALNSYLGLGIDITTSKDSTDIKKKLDRILRYDVERDSPAQVKYYESHEIKRAISVPRVIVALQDDQIKSLFRLEDRGNKEALAGHEAHLIMLYQLQQQCTTFFNLAKKAGSEKSMMIYGRAQQIITDVIEQKQALFAKHPTLIESDPSSMDIWRYCDEKEREAGIGEAHPKAA